MNRIQTVVSALLTISACLMFCGCSNRAPSGDIMTDFGRGFESIWPFATHQPIHAQQIVVHSFYLPMADRKAVDRRNTQQLKIDMHSGRASITSLDGRIFPHQIDDKTLKQLDQAIAPGSWDIGRRMPRMRAELTRFFEMTVMVNDEAYTRHPTLWSDADGATQQKPIPEALAKVQDIFLRSQRVVHPLSEQVDLIR